MNNKITYIAVGAALLLGSIGSIAIQAYAQNSTTPTNTTSVVQNSTSTQNQTSLNDPKDLQGPDTDNVQDGNQGHRPLGGDGIVSSINGSTIVMGEESDEGSASYTVDASNATITNHGVAAQISDIKAGDKIFVEGAVTGDTVKATSISLGHPNFRGHEDGTNDGETNDDGGSPSTSSN